MIAAWYVKEKHAILEVDGDGKLEFKEPVHQSVYILKP
jgi:hypothetical protein